MTRETSLQAYRTIKENGLLSKRRWEVYEALHRLGPMTAMETARNIPGSLDHSISPRFAELKTLGVIVETCTRKCSITGREVIVWKVTNRLPIKVVKPTKSKCPHCKGRGYLVQERLL